MQTDSVIKRYTHFFIASFVVGTALIFQGKDLLFFDEDIFVTNLQSPFMQQAWERSFFIKQFLKAENFFFGQNPAGYHIVSVLLHIVCATAGLLLFRQLLKNCAGCLNGMQQQTAQFIFYLFFLITPVHSEPLCYILAQGILVFTFFAVLTVLFFIKAITGDRRFFVVSLLFYAVTLLCYEISWMIPFINFCLVMFYPKTAKRTSSQSIWFMTAAFFIVLAVWFYIKTAFISTSLVADYGNITAANIDIITAARNGAILFVRNFIPPLNNSSYFIIAALSVLIILATAVFWIIKKQPKLFSFVLLLSVFIVLSFAPTSPFGIDSHDSESERYVYFSSVFAVMLLAVLAVSVLKNNSILRIAVGAVCIIYSAVLFNTVSYYKTGGVFSQKYLAALNKFTQDAGTVYTVNQPSQFHGALLIRALSRIPAKSGGTHTVLSEYMNYLYGNTQTAYITFSAKELNGVPKELKAVMRPLEQAGLYFPETLQLQPVLGNGNNVAIAALRNDSLYIFR